MGGEGKLFLETAGSYGSIVASTAKMFIFDFQEQGTAKKIINRTFQIGGFYNLYDGKAYYLLKDVDDQTIGIGVLLLLKRDNIKQKKILGE